MDLYRLAGSADLTLLVDNPIKGSKIIFNRICANNVYKYPI